MTLSAPTPKTNPLFGLLFSIALVIGVLVLAFYVGREMLAANAQSTDCVVETADGLVPCPEETLEPMGQLDADDRLKQITEPHGVGTS